MLMMIILAALFILTPMFRKKENEKTKETKKRKEKKIKLIK